MCVYKYISFMGVFIKSIRQFGRNPNGNVYAIRIGVFFLLFKTVMQRILSMLFVNATQQNFYGTSLTVFLFREKTSYIVCIRYTFSFSLKKSTFMD